MGRFYAAIARPASEGARRGRKVFLLRSARRRSRPARCSTPRTCGQAPALRQQVRDPGRARPAARREPRGHRPHADGRGRTAEGLCRSSSRSRPMPERRRRSISTASSATITCARIPSRAISSINLLPKGERTRASHAIALDIRHRLADLPLPEAPRSRSSRFRPARRCSRPCSRRSMGRTRRPPRRGREGAQGFRRRSISSSTSTTATASPRTACASRSTRRRSSSTGSRSRRSTTRSARSSAG